MLGQLICQHGEMGLVWRVDEIDKLRREFAEASSGVDLGIDGNWADFMWDDGESHDPGVQKWFDWLMGPDWEFYCGNGLPYNWEVIEYELGTPMHNGWSDD